MRPPNANVTFSPSPCRGSRRFPSASSTSPSPRSSTSGSSATTCPDRWRAGQGRGATSGRATRRSSPPPLPQSDTRSSRGASCATSRPSRVRTDGSPPATTRRPGPSPTTVRPSSMPSVSSSGPSPRWAPPQNPKRPHRRRRAHSPSSSR
ncbi:Uncharacterised protein [Mycobacteroides abscessus subsp. abscessus]|nr:Uncharacterised protein [Mycobacteroides abscessus subsp. abscessus]